MRFGSALAFIAVLLSVFVLVVFVEGGGSGSAYDDDDDDDSGFTTIAPPPFSAQCDDDMQVDSNPGNHPNLWGGKRKMQVGIDEVIQRVRGSGQAGGGPPSAGFMMRDVQTSGMFPVMGSIDMLTGEFMATGTGMYSGFPTSAMAEGRLKAFPDGRFKVNGLVTVGGQGELPGGQPIVYDLEDCEGQLPETPSPSPTPDPTPTLEPTPTPTPSPTPAGVPRLWGDANCDGAVNSLDALSNLLAIANLPVPQADGCPPVKSMVLVDGVPRIWGDEDCSGAKDAIDALFILLFISNLPRPSPAAGCPELEEEVMVQSVG